MSAGSLSPLLLLTSPLGDDTRPVQQGTLHAIALSAHEQLSEPFAVQLTAVSTEREIDPDELVYQLVCVTLRKRPHADRFFNGIVRRLEAIGLARRDRWTYRLEIVPRLWFMSQAADCRIFQQKSTVQILQTLFAEHRVAPVEWRIYGEQPILEYTTQFNETDLAFVHRLLQEAGYFYFFEHSLSAHSLVISDRNQSFRTIEHPEHWVVHEGNNIDIFDRWSRTLQTALGKVSLQDYDPTRPGTPVIGQQTTILPTAGTGQREVFNWPAMTTRNQIANDRARFRIESSEAQAGLRSGHGFDPEFYPGARFVLARDPFTEALGVDHVLRSIEHTATDDSWITGGSEPHYENDFTCFLQETPWREQLSLQRPAMTGIFSAIVLGNAGEEIHADPIGRIKVRLLFDHRRETVADMAIWVRVMQPWSGDRWGWQHLPRVGTEVAVSFMHGDPDAPVVVGGFYNEEMRPVFPIPEQQTRQGFRSRSTLKGTTQEYSELSFDDRKGQEMLFVHAQRDHTTEVEHDQSLSVTESRKVSIGRDETKTIGHDYSLTSHTGGITITADVGSVDISAMTRISLRVGPNSIVITPVGITITADVDINLAAGGIVSTEAGGDVNLTGGGAVTVEAGGDVNLAAVGAVTVEAAGVLNLEGTEVSIEALDGAVVCLPFPI